VAILGDLPGPKIRIGEVRDQPYELQMGNRLVLANDEIRGGRRRVSVSFAALPRLVRPGDTLYLSDGFIQLELLTQGPSRENPTGNQRLELLERTPSSLYRCSHPAEES